MTTFAELLAKQRGVRLVSHAWLTFSGTWAAPGTGYCSWVVQGAIAGGANVFEVPVISPWSFGFLGGALNAPSYRQSVNIAVEWAIAWLLAHPLQTFGLGGYSQGGEAASRVYHELQPGGRLESVAHNYIGGFTFGNPSREAGHTFPGGADPGGSGISNFNLTNTDVNWHDHANPGDLYTTKPAGPVGKDMEDVYELAIDLQLNDPIGFFTAFIQHTLQVVHDLGGASSLLTGLASGSLLTSAATGLIGGLVPALLGGLGGGLLGGLGGSLLGGLGGNVLGGLGGNLFGGLTGNLAGGLSGGAQSTGIASAVQAAIIGLKFLMHNPPTAPHITYEFTEAAPGVTHLAHAINHVNQRTALPARAAA